jgi:hypothetical protein
LVLRATMTKVAGMKHPEEKNPAEAICASCGKPQKDHCTPQTLGQATARVAEMAHLGYTESIVVDDLRIRLEKLESKIRELETTNARLRVQP